MLLTKIKTLLSRQDRNTGWSYLPVDGLIEEGAAVDAGEKDGTTSAFVLAGRTGQVNLPVIKGADVNAATEDENMFSC